MRSPDAFRSVETGVETSLANLGPIGTADH